LFTAFNGIVSTNICETIAPASPTVTDQWNATAGKYKYSPRQLTLNETENSTRISGYNHKNVTFAKKVRNQVYETFPFGDYVTSATFAFSFDKTVEKCNSSNLVYNYTSSEALIRHRTKFDCQYSDSLK
jgi:hypothetical protein